MPGNTRGGGEGVFVEPGDVHRRALRRNGMQLADSMGDCMQQSNPGAYRGEATRGECSPG
jgi:hypothetical protein